MTFTSVEQRMANAYLDMFPAFVPDEELTELRAQDEFYRMMEALYRLAYDEPERFVPQLHEDDAYPNRFNKSSYGKPELIKNMRKFLKEMDGLLDAMFQMGRGAAVPLSKRRRSVLKEIGILEGGALPEAWKALSSRENADVKSFSRCLFREGYPYFRDVYARLLGDEAAFGKLERFMLGRGYTRFDMLRPTASDDDFSMTYANLAWCAEAPGGGFEYKIKHTGISVRYDAYARKPAVLGLLIPGGLKRFLSGFDRMSERARAMIIERTKACDGCGYCVQTDKTGKRPQAAMEVRYQGAEHRLCPYFPGCSYAFTELDDRRADELIDILASMDGFLG